MKVHYIQHAHFETPGIVEEWAKERGLEIAGTKVYADERLPRSSDLDFLIVLGGPQSPRETAEFPYLSKEMALISTLVREGKPIVGFCLGAQLIAEALGGKTSQSQEKEIGVFPIRLTNNGQADPILQKLPTEMDVFHWHNDMPGIPDGAVVLAESAGCPHQGFRFGDRTYGLQFHMEATKESVAQLVEHAHGDLRPGKYTQSAKEILSADYTTMNKHMKYILDRLQKFA